MTPIEYFKLQAKNMFRDYKTQTSYIDDVDGNSYFKYDPKYFDIDSIFLSYHGFFDEGWDEKNLSLMQIQHLLAYMLGFEKWADLAKASEAELELAKLLFDHQDKISLDDWEMYIGDVEHDNRTPLDTEARIGIFNMVFANVEGHSSSFGGYRITKQNLL
jgi:hypothetical protein